MHVQLNWSKLDTELSMHMSPICVHILSGHDLDLDLWPFDLKVHSLACP